MSRAFAVSNRPGYGDGGAPRAAPLALGDRLRVGWRGRSLLLLFSRSPADYRAALQADGIPRQAPAGAAEREEPIVAHAASERHPLPRDADPPPDTVAERKDIVESILDAVDRRNDLHEMAAASGSDDAAEPDA